MQETTLIPAWCGELDQAPNKSTGISYNNDDLARGVVLKRSNAVGVRDFLRKQTKHLEVRKMDAKSVWAVK